MCLALHFTQARMFFAFADHRLPPWCRGPRECGLQSAGTAFPCAQQCGGYKAKCLLLMVFSTICLHFSPKTPQYPVLPMCLGTIGGQFAERGPSLLLPMFAPATSWAPPYSAPGAACGRGARSQLEPGPQWEDLRIAHIHLQLLCSILSPGGTLQAKNNGVKEGFPLTRQLLDYTLRDQRCSRESTGSKL